MKHFEKSVLGVASSRCAIMVVILALGVPLAISAQQGLYIYPAKDQSKDQMDKDKYQCNEWAVKQTGFNPMNEPTATAPPPPQQTPRGGMVRGGALGAGLGAAGGAIAGNAGKGAAIGALTGGVLGRMRRQEQVRSNNQAQQQWAQQQSASYDQRRSQWLSAYKTCLSGRGYTVN
jgi:hypothetical protein